MPSSSQAQHNFMVRACVDADFAKEHNISQKVACEYVAADKKAGKWQKKKKSKKKISKEGHPSLDW